jgi:hypothetical protein
MVCCGDEDTDTNPYNPHERGIQIRPVYNNNAGRDMSWNPRMKVIETLEDDDPELDEQQAAWRH